MISKNEIMMQRVKKSTDYYCINLKKCLESKRTKHSCNMNLKPSLTCAFLNRDCPAVTLVAYIENDSLSVRSPINDVIEYCINKLNINSSDLIVCLADNMLEQANAEFNELCDFLEV